MFVVFPKGRIIFYEEGEGGGGVWRFYGGGHIFSEPKKGGHVFLQGLILIFFLKGMQISEIRVFAFNSDGKEWTVNCDCGIFI